MAVMPTQDEEIEKARGSPNIADERSDVAPNPEAVAESECGSDFTQPTVSQTIDSSPPTPSAPSSEFRPRDQGVDGAQDVNTTFNPEEAETSWRTGEQSPSRLTRTSSYQSTSSQIDDQSSEQIERIDRLTESQHQGLIATQSGTEASVTAASCESSSTAPSQVPIAPEPTTPLQISDNSLVAPVQDNRAVLEPNTTSRSVLEANVQNLGVESDSQTEPVVAGTQPHDSMVQGDQPTTSNLQTSSNTLPVEFQQGDPVVQQSMAPSVQTPATVPAEFQGDQPTSSNLQTSNTVLVDSQQDDPVQQPLVANLQTVPAESQGDQTTASSVQTAPIDPQGDPTQSTPGVQVAQVESGVQNAAVNSTLQDKSKTKSKRLREHETRDGEASEENDDEDDDDEKEEQGTHGKHCEAPDIAVEKSPLGRFVRFKQKLGAGSYKTVYLGFDTDTGKEIAWNVINFQDMKARERKRITEEINLLKSIKHARIVSFISAWINKKEEQVCFITERVSGGSLLHYIRRIDQPLKTKIMRNWSRQIAEGLEYLHESTIIHRDLKCDNVFIHGNVGEVLIGDLGLSTTLNQTYAASIVGTPEFMAPELYDEKYGTPVDIYAFGMCLLEMVSQGSPFKECTTAAQVYKKVMAGQKPQVVKRIKDGELRALVEQCINLIPEQRPLAKTLVGHPWLQANETDGNIQVELVPEEEVKEDESSLRSIPEEGSPEEQRTETPQPQSRLPSGAVVVQTGSNVPSTTVGSNIPSTTATTTTSEGTVTAPASQSSNVPSNVPAPSGQESTTSNLVMTGETAVGPQSQPPIQQNPVQGGHPQSVVPSSNPNASSLSTGQQQEPHTGQPLQPQQVSQQQPTQQVQAPLQQQQTPLPQQQPPQPTQSLQPSPPVQAAQHNTAQPPHSELPLHPSPAVQAAPHVTPQLPQPEQSLQPSVQVAPHGTAQQALQAPADQQYPQPGPTQQPYTSPAPSQPLHKPVEQQVHPQETVPQLHQHVSQVQPSQVQPPVTPPIQQHSHPPQSTSPQTHVQPGVPPGGTQVGMPGGAPPSLSPNPQQAVVQKSTDVPSPVVPQQVLGTQTVLQPTSPMHPGTQTAGVHGATVTQPGVGQTTQPPPNNQSLQTSTPVQPQGYPPSQAPISTQMQPTQAPQQPPPHHQPPQPTQSSQTGNTGSTAPSISEGVNPIQEQRTFASNKSPRINISNSPAGFEDDHFTLDDLSMENRNRLASDGQKLEVQMEMRPTGSGDMLQKFQTAFEKEGLSSVSQVVLEIKKVGEPTKLSVTFDFDIWKDSFLSVAHELREAMSEENLPGSMEDLMMDIERAVYRRADEMLREVSGQMVTTATNATPQTAAPEQMAEPPTSASTTTAPEVSRTMLAENANNTTQQVTGEMPADGQTSPVQVQQLLSSEFTTPKRAVAVLSAERCSESDLSTDATKRSEVVLLQKSLMYLFAEKNIKKVGDWCEGTTEAIKSFQDRHGLPGQKGEADGKFWEKLLDEVKKKENKEAKRQEDKAKADAERLAKKAEQDRVSDNLLAQELSKCAQQLGGNNAVKTKETEGKAPAQGSVQPQQPAALTGQQAPAQGSVPPQQPAALTGQQGQQLSMQAPPQGSVQPQQPAALTGQQTQQLSMQAQASVQQLQQAALTGQQAPQLSLQVSAPLPTAPISPAPSNVPSATQPLQPELITLAAPPTPAAVQITSAPSAQQPQQQQVVPPSVSPPPVDAITAQQSVQSTAPSIPQSLLSVEQPQQAALIGQQPQLPMQAPSIPQTLLSVEQPQQAALTGQQPQLPMQAPSVPQSQGSVPQPQQAPLAGQQPQQLPHMQATTLQTPLEQRSQLQTPLEQRSQTPSPVPPSATPMQGLDQPQVIQPQPQLAQETLIPVPAQTVQTPAQNVLTTATQPLESAEDPQDMVRYASETSRVPVGEVQASSGGTAAISSAPLVDLMASSTAPSNNASLPPATSFSPSCA